MTPLGAVFGGTLLVVLDLRLDTFDLVPDPLGWAMVVWAGVRLIGVHPAFRWAVGAALVGLVVSLPGQVAELPTALGVLGMAAETVVLFAVCTAIHACSTDPARARQAGLVRWWDLVVTGFAVLVPLLATQAEDVATALVVPLVVAAMVIVVWYLVILWSVRDEPTFAHPRRRPVGGPDDAAPLPTA